MKRLLLRRACSERAVDVAVPRLMMKRGHDIEARHRKVDHATGLITYAAPISLTNKRAFSQGSRQGVAPRLTATLTNQNCIAPTRNF